jgi:hypothetical protein
MIINSLDYGILERDFWEMTPAEVIRAVNSKKNVLKIEAQNKASYDYILAGLIVKGVSIALGSKEQYPQIEEIYPSLFSDVTEEKNKEIERQKAELSAARFKQFAQSYNAKFKNKEVSNKD